MHPPVREWVTYYLPAEYESVLEIGSLDINGGVRDLLRDKAQYTGVDEQEGPGVDVVMNFLDYIPPEPVDVVLCLEVLEHTADWPKIVFHAAECLKPKGMFLMTCATTGRPAHSARGTGPIQPDEYYRNVTEQALRWVLAHRESGFSDWGTNVQGFDLRCWAVKS